MATLDGSGVGSSIFVTRTAGDALIDGLHVTGGGEVTPDGGRRYTNHRRFVRRSRTAARRQPRQQRRRSLRLLLDECRAHGELRHQDNAAVYTVSGSGYGGGAYFNVGSASLINCTIVDNTAVAVAGGVGRFTAPVTIFNCILSNNLVGATPMDLNSGFNLAYSYTDAAYTGTGNLSAADGPPGFVDAGTDDFSLATDSICIDTGVESYATYTPPSSDILGADRPYGAGFDMGAYECQQPKDTGDVYVSASTGDDSTGTARPLVRSGRLAGLSRAWSRARRFTSDAGIYAENVTLAQPVVLDGEYSGFASDA